VYCQLLDSLYPGRVPLGKVNWRARLEYEFLQNYKLLQAVLERLGIDKKMDVQSRDNADQPSCQVQVSG